jgi:hypothetical protein
MGAINPFLRPNYTMLSTCRASQVEAARLRATVSPKIEMESAHVEIPMSKSLFHKIVISQAAFPQQPCLPKPQTRPHRALRDAIGDLATPIHQNRRWRES